MEKIDKKLLQAGRLAYGCHLKVLEAVGRHRPYKTDNIDEVMKVALSTAAKFPFFESVVGNYAMWQVEKLQDSKVEFVEGRKVPCKALLEAMQPLGDQDKAECLRSAVEMLCSHIFTRRFELFEKISRESKTQMGSDSMKIEQFLARNPDRKLLGSTEIADLLEISSLSAGKSLASMGYKKVRVTGRGDNQCIWVLDPNVAKNASKAELKKLWQDEREDDAKPALSFI